MKCQLNEPIFSMCSVTEIDRALSSVVGFKEASVIRKHCSRVKGRMKKAHHLDLCPSA